jgi:excisionase family DNA binding protein
MTLSAHQPSLVDDVTVPALLRPNDVARLFAVSRAWVYEAARTGRIPSVRLGGDDGPLRFVADDLEQWLTDARATWRPVRSSRPVQATPEQPASVVPIRGQQSLL